MGTETFDPMHFREVLGQYPTGVCVVTAIHEDGPVGMAVGTFTSVSLNPPLVAFLPDQSSSSWAKIRTSPAFCVNVLGAEQENLCRVFASRVPDKFAGLRWRPAPSGSPILEGAVAWIDCLLDVAHEAGDHHIAIGRVTGLAVEQQALPLLFYRGGYGQFTPLSFTAMDGDILDRLGTVDLVRPAMEALAAELQLDCMASLQVGEECVFVARAGGRGDARTSTQVGRRLPLRPPVGGTLLAWAESADQEAWISRSGAASGWTPDRGRLLLDRIRARGYAIGVGRDAFQNLWTTLVESGQGRSGHQLQGPVEGLDSGWSQDEVRPDEIYEVGILTAPVFGPQGVPLLQLSLVGMAEPMTGEQIEHAGRRLLAAAEAATVAVGGRLLVAAG